jgi:hypothetical protein
VLLCLQERAVAHEMGAVQKARTDLERIHSKCGQLQKELVAAIKTLEGWVKHRGAYVQHVQRTQAVGDDTPLPNICVSVSWLPCGGTLLVCQQHLP